MSAPLAVLLSVVVGGVLGAVNGLLIAYGRVHAIIITFGTANLFLFLGPADLRLAHGQRHPGDVRRSSAAATTAERSASRTPSRSPWSSPRSRGGTCGTPPADGTSTPSAATRTPPGSRASGSSAAILLAYLITGLLVGLGSCFVIAQGTSTLDQSVGTGKELAVIAAVVIGGTSIMGGRGSVLGTLLGALLVQTVTSGVTQLGWSSQLSDLFVGIFIIVAVGTDLSASAHPEDTMTTTEPSTRGARPRHARPTRRGALAAACCARC